jgi:hypothetical protein
VERRRSVKLSKIQSVSNQSENILRENRNLCDLPDEGRGREEEREPGVDLESGTPVKNDDVRHR